MSKSFIRKDQVPLRWDMQVVRRIEMTLHITIDHIERFHGDGKDRWLLLRVDDESLLEWVKKFEKDCMRMGPPAPEMMGVEVGYIHCCDPDAQLKIVETKGHAAGKFEAKALCLRCGSPWSILGGFVRAARHEVSSP